MFWQRFIPCNLRMPLYNKGQTWRSRSSLGFPTSRDPGVFEVYLHIGVFSRRGNPWGSMSSGNILMFHVCLACLGIRHDGGIWVTWLHVSHIVRYPCSCGACDTPLFTPCLDMNKGVMLAILRSEILALLCLHVRTRERNIYRYGYSCLPSFSLYTQYFFNISLFFYFLFYFFFFWLFLERWKGNRSASGLPSYLRNTRMYCGHPCRGLS